MRLDELGNVARGKSRHRPRNDPSLYGGPYPFFQTGDIKAANFYLRHTEQTYNEKGLAQSRMWPPGTLCITIAANIAESGFLAVDGCFPDSVVGFIADSEKADARFVKYSLDTMKSRMQSVSRGTTQDNLSVEKLLSFHFLVPSLDIQHRIAGILSDYDDLIEVNTRRIATLEEMARRLFDECFVDEMHAAQNQNETAPVASFLSHTIGGTWGKDASDVDDDVRASVIRGTDMPGWRVGIVNRIPDRFIPARTLSSRALSPGDVIVEVSGGSTDQPVGRCILIGPEMRRLLRPDVTFASFCRLARPNAEVVAPVTLYLFFDWLYRSRRVMEYQTQSTGISNLRFSLLIERECVPLLKRDARERFEKIVEPLMLLCDSLAATCHSLRSARDLLLPKLISGEIDVSAAAHAMEAAE